jgi:hypothetical protein
VALAYGGHGFPDGLDPHHFGQVVRAHPGAIVHDHRDLRGQIRVAHREPHQEPVELRLGQPVRALHLDRVLRRHHQERAGHLARHGVHRHPPLGHHLQQRRLGLRRAAVDLVGQHDVGEDRAGVEPEPLLFLVVDRDAGDVAGQQVRGELDAAPPPADAAGQTAGERGLTEAGHVLDQQVPLGQQGGQRHLDQLRLAFDHLLDVGRYGRRDLRRIAAVHCRPHWPPGHTMVLDLATSVPPLSTTM